MLQVTSLLGVPAPRQSMGAFVEPVLHELIPTTQTRLKQYADLARQKQSLAKIFMDQISQSTHSDACFAVSYDTEVECVAIVDGCLALIASGRDNQLKATTIRNTLLAFALIVVIDIFCARAIEQFTFGSLRAVCQGFCEKKCWTEFGSFLLDYLCPSRCVGGSTYLSQFNGKHKATFFVAFLFVCFYYASSIFFFLMAYVSNSCWSFSCERLIKSLLS